MTVEALETKRRAAQRQLDQALAPQRQLELAHAELDAIDEQLGQARREEQEARRTEQQRASDIASAESIFYGTSPELRDALRPIYAAQLRLAAYGVLVEDRVINVRSIVEPLFERDRIV
jgi:hypothetical protein